MDESKTLARYPRTARVALVFGLLGTVVGVSTGASGQTAPSSAVEEAGRLSDAFQFDQVVTLLDNVIEATTASPAPDFDALVRAYELRGRAHFNLGNEELAALDFERLLQTQADHELTTDLSPRIVELFDGVKQRLVGVLLLSMPRGGIVTIDGRDYQVGVESAISLVHGAHEFAIRQAGFREEVRQIDIIAGVPTMLTVAMTRISGTLSVVTIPDGARILVDDALQGVTAPGSGAGSAPLLVDDLAPGQHRLRLERECFVPFETSFTVATPPGDDETSPLELTPAVATATVRTAATGAMIYLDGEPRGLAPAEMTDLCEGPHVIEVRAPTGRFVDRRVWAAGATADLDAELRPAFALVEVAGIADQATMGELTARVEAALAGTRGILIFSPPAAELTAAAGDPVLAMALSNEEATLTRRRDLAQAWSERLGSQGVAWLSPAADAVDAYDLFLLASNSGEPDVVRLGLGDVASRTAAQRRLGAAPPSVVRATLQTSVVDVAGIDGAAVIQVEPGGAGDTAGLGPGDIIVGAAGAPVTLASDLATVVARAEANAELSLAVQGEDGTARTVSIRVTLVPDTIPMADPSLLYNKILLDLGALAERERGAMTGTAASLNLAVAHMRLGSWDHAMLALESASLPVGPGVSAATVDYLLGLCLKEIGEVEEARAALGRAAAAAGALLSVGGPPIASLAARQLELLP